MPTLLFFKLTIVPLLIGVVTLIEKKWGPTVAGWFSAFPIIAGPILAFFCIEQSPDFAGVAALNTLKGLHALLVYGLAYCWTARYQNWPICLIVALSSFFICSFTLLHLDLTLTQTAISILASLIAAPYIFPQARGLITNTRRSNWAIALRMSLGALLVLCVSWAAKFAGPELSGLLVVVPVASAVLSVASHRSTGAECAIQLLRGMLPGWYAFSGFLVILIVMLQRANPFQAFGAAFCSAIFVQLISRRAMRKEVSEPKGATAIQSPGP